MKFLKNKTWFSLIEVIISALLLSVVVFSILRLSNNNSNQGILLEKNNLLNEIFFSSRECIKSLWYDNLIILSWTSSLNFGIWNTKCIVWTYNADLSFTWIILKNYYDWSEVWEDEFWTYFTTISWTNYVNINQFTTDGKNTINYEYKIYK